MTATMKILRRSVNDQGVRRSISRILRANELCSIATVTPNGKAYVNTVEYAYSRRYEICFVSYPESIHTLNLLRNSSMAVAIFDSHQKWYDSHLGLQFFGKCKEEKDPRMLRKLEAWYAKRFRGYRKWRRELEADTLNEFPLRFYRFTPSRIKVFDEKEFGGGTWILVSIRER